MALSEAKRRSNNKYISAHYSQLGVKYPNPFVAAVKTTAKYRGQSLAGYIRQAIEERMQRDGDSLPDDPPPPDTP